MSSKEKKREEVTLFKPEEIKTMRLRAGLTQEQFAEELKVSSRTLRQWEQSESKPSPKFIPKLLQFQEKVMGNVQNINGTNAQGTQIIGDGQTTNNHPQPCGEEQTETSKLLDAHNTLIEQIRQLTAVIASQQETISRLVANNQ